MDINVSNAKPETIKKHCIVIPVSDQKTLRDSSAEIDRASDGYLKDVLKQGDLDARAGSTLLLHKVPGVSASRVMLVSTGANKGKISAANFDKMSVAVASALLSTNCTEFSTCVCELEVEDRDLAWMARSVSLAACSTEYQFTLHKNKDDELEKRPRKVADKLTIVLPDRKLNKTAEQGLKQGVAIASGLSTARDLGNMAPNYCTPTYLAQHAATLKKTYKSLKVTVLDEAQMKKLNMGAFLSVSAGSEEPAKLICMEYKGGKATEKPVVLVGKGVTFDTGGISLKQGEGMDEMKFDMCGAASVFGVMHAVAELELPINIVGTVAAAENMPGGKATKPGDIVTTMSGQTVEILNTDAEGRLVLCDTLTYIAKYKPDVVIDIATLTGAVIVALGNSVFGLMSNNDQLADDLFNAGLESGDKCWRLPVWDEYQAQLKSNFADIPNIGDRAAGSITAGCFLARFAQDYKWAHLDIAGVAWKKGAAKGATGRPVPMLMQYLLERCT